MQSSGNGAITSACHLNQVMFYDRHSFAHFRDLPTTVKFFPLYSNIATFKGSLRSESSTAVHANLFISRM